MQIAKLVLMVIVAVLLLGFVSGCPKPAEPTDTTRIGVSYQNMRNEFIITIQDALRAKAKELNVDIIEADGQGDAVKQIAHVENYIVQGVDAIILNPFDRHGCVPAVNKVVEAGIPLVVVNALVDNVDKAHCYIGSNDVEAGRIEMQYIADRLGGKGKIAVMHGPHAHSANIQRNQGIDEILADHPEIEVVLKDGADWDRAKAMALMENWLQTDAGAQIKAVVALNDEMALGAYKAIEAAGRAGDILIIGVDAIPDALQAVKKGQLAATVFQDARGQGAGAVELAVKILNGEQVDKVNYIPFILVTQDNLAEFMPPE